MKPNPEEYYEKEFKRMRNFTEGIRIMRDSDDYTEEEKWELYNHWYDLRQEYLRAKYFK